MAASVKEVHCPVTDGVCQAVNKTPCTENPSRPLCETRSDDLTNKILAMTLQGFKNGGLERLLKEGADAVSEETVKTSPLTSIVAQTLANAKDELGLSVEQAKVLYVRAAQNARTKFIALFGHETSLTEEIAANHDLENRIHPIE